MPTLHGIGQSNATHTKQWRFTKIIQQHLATCGAIFAKHSWTSDCYQYIDANAGCGHNEAVGCEGSPIIFLREAQEKGILYAAHLVEIDPQNAMLLQATVARWNSHEVIIGDNREIVPDLVADLPANSYGLLYTDPNGVPDFDLLAEVSQHPRLKRVDILIRYAASAVKRNKHITGKRMLDYLRMIRKQHWIVCEVDHSDKWQWTFLLGMNWDGLRVMKQYGFHYAHSPEGQAIIERLNYTNDERRALYQPSLFQADPPYSSYAEYLRHPQFKAIRALVFRRAAGACERCLQRPPTEPHHLRYPPWGMIDVPENLIAVCHECHCEIHGKAS
jgi:three-Cys-motif partner protein